MATEGSVKDDYGFVTYPTRTRNVSREQSPTYSGFERSPPDQRRFAIALSELPALNFYNPLLNNPSSSEYIASVRSSLRSIDETASGHLNMHPRLAGVRDGSIGSTNPTSAVPYWSQNSVKSVESSHTSETEHKSSITFSTSCPHAAKSVLAVCVCIWTILFLGLAVTTVVYFTGKGSSLFHPPQAPAANVIYGEFHIYNQTMPSGISEGNSVPTIFNDLAQELQEKMDRAFQSSTMLSSLYNRSAMFGIVPNNTSQNPSIRIQFQIHLNHADVMIAEKMAHAFTTNLHRKEEHDGQEYDNWSLNLTTVKFAEFIATSVKNNVPPHDVLASWGPWTEWTPSCSLGSFCDPSRKQSRNRRCLLRDRRPEEPVELTNQLMNNVITPCTAGSTVSAADVEIRPCNCANRTPPPRIRFNVVRPTKVTHYRFSNTSIATFDQFCSKCRQGEVCVARLEEVVPVCRWAPEPEDPTGCGGFCRAHTESCVPLGSNSYRCEGVSECMSDIEWRCRDGFCIHNSKRCDRDYNCFDHSDELDCEAMN
uniref:Nfx1-type zinc finger-containing protein n=1 Tax=Daphnia magna TaxID=35525 RepID=A0A0P6EP99_9CRUS